MCLSLISIYFITRLKSEPTVKKKICFCLVNRVKGTINFWFLVGMVRKKFTLSLLESIMETCDVVLTFESVGEILHCMV